MPIYEGPKLSGLPAMKKSDEIDRSASGIAAAITRLIETRVYGPGERIIEQEIADRFDVSRGPVREAIRMLSARGVLKLTHQRGASVVKMSDEEAIDSIEISAVLFGLAARRAARNATEAHRQEISAAAVRLEQLAEGEISSSDFFQETLAAGRIVLQASGSERLSQEILHVRAGAPNLLGPLCFASKPVRRKAASTWLKLAEQICRGEESKAERLAIKTHDDARQAAIEATS